MIHLITGYAGYEHIKSADDGAFNAAFFGGGQFVMESGNQFAGSIIDNNTVRILDGDGLMFGRHFRLEPNSYEDVTITTGTAGKNRVDLVCVTYKKNESDGTEQTYLEVIKGAEADGTAAVPAYTTGNILEGAVFNQMPFYEVELDGVVLKSIKPLFETIPTYKTLAEQAEQKFTQQFEEAVDEYSEAVETAQTTADNAIARLDDMGIDLLWQNASPTSNMYKQKIELDLTNYEGVFVNDVFIKVGFSTNINVPVAFDSSTYGEAYRFISVDSSGVNVDGVVAIKGSTPIWNRDDLAIVKTIHGVR